MTARVEFQDGREMIVDYVRYQKTAIAASTTVVGAKPTNCQGADRNVPPDQGPLGVDLPNCEI
jgi:hypothetical protein